VLSFRELRLVVDYLEGSLSVATCTWYDSAWIGGTASGTIYRSVMPTTTTCKTPVSGDNGRFNFILFRCAFLIKLFSSLLSNLTIMTAVKQSTTRAGLVDMQLESCCIKAAFRFYALIAFCRMLSIVFVLTLKLTFKAKVQYSHFVKYYCWSWPWPDSKSFYITQDTKRRLGLQVLSLIETILF